MSEVKGFADIDSYRAFYRGKLGEAPNDTHIYNYYLNMIDCAIQSGAGDTDFNRDRFPHSIRTKQEMIKIIMIIQADARKDEPKKPVALEKKKKTKIFNWRNK